MHETYLFSALSAEQQRQLTEYRITVLDQLVLNVTRETVTVTQDRVSENTALPDATDDPHHVEHLKK